MPNATRTIATAVATLVVSVGVVAVTSVPANANTDTSWGYIKPPVHGG